MSSTIMRVFFLSALSLSTQFLIAQTTTISGTAHSDYIGKPAYLYAVGDAISGFKELADSTTVTPDGKLSFEFKCERITEVIISIDRVNAPFFTAPGSKYQVNFPQLPADQAKTFNNSNTINIEFINLSESDINLLIGRFNTKYDAFFDNNVADVFDKEFRSKLNEFRVECDSVFKPFKIPYLNDYIQYTFANFELSIGSSRKMMSEKYLTNSNTDITNPEFTEFASTFFGNYTDRFDMYSKSKPLSSAIAKANSTEFIEQLKNDDGLRNSTELREIVALINLSQEYAKNRSPKAKLLKMIADVSLNSTGKQTKVFSKNLLNSLTQFSPGSRAYPFSLKRTDGGIVSLESLKGKPSVLAFAASWSRESLAELRLLNDLYLKYNSEVNFVLIGLDNTEAGMQSLLTASATKLQIKASYTSDKYLVEAMNILYVPQFVLLDKDGNYIKCFAPEPSRGLDSALESLLKLQ